MEQDIVENTEQKRDRNSGTVYIHRVGTVTLGISLIVFGILFLMHIFFPALDYRTIFHVWPCIFIFLGTEVLLGSKGQKFEFDKTAIFLILILAVFAMFMGMADYWIEIEKNWFYIK